MIFIGKQTEEVVSYSCDFCGEDCNTKHTPFEFKGKYFCNDCKEELTKIWAVKSSGYKNRLSDGRR